MRINTFVKRSLDRVSCSFKKGENKGRKGSRFIRVIGSLLKALLFARYSR